MSQKNSGRARVQHELYETPAWVVIEGLAPHIEIAGSAIGEPCCGRGKMVAALVKAGARTVFPSDVKRHGRRVIDMPLFRQLDFVNSNIIDYPRHLDGLAFNPPYGPQGKLAEAFIHRGLHILQTSARPMWMAALLSIDFDSASTRAQLFEQCEFFHAAISLRRRIEWFPREKDKSGPSVNHAWFIWRSTPRAPGVFPVKLYAPDPKATMASSAAAAISGNTKSLLGLSAFRAVARSHGVDA